MARERHAAPAVMGFPADAEPVDGIPVEQAGISHASNPHAIVIGTAVRHEFHSASNPQRESEASSSNAADTAEFKPLEPHERPSSTNTDELHRHSLQPNSRPTVTATLIPVEAPPEPSFEQRQRDHMEAASREAFRLLSQGSRHAVVIARPPEGSELPTLIAQQMPNGSFVVQEVPVTVPYQCTTGWVLFFVGFIMPPAWLVGAFLPFCTHDQNDRRASVLNSLAFVIFIFLLIGLASTIQ
ncbi:hypothetical protein CEUSTIGMA_g2483.t1 [Chlamydomonas eustigma]|uniref:Uncharacterized protein n=1 Tax=Chlamydomonas eustigma TaxID=1157962 RepID=A0A250WWF9_9CHLO|nr:hypothetical protein CEUSTIGMA_g2483.t1 [Chlamydomonas eustigma]|eukprot:GAX75039.1 hypothetical protein CEUSTIGMA_g2483.t1 [Chlamydomonas eustigma]